MNLASLTFCIIKFCLCLVFIRLLIVTFCFMLSMRTQPFPNPRLSPPSWVFWWLLQVKLLIAYSFFGNTITPPLNIIYLLRLQIIRASWWRHRLLIVTWLILSKTMGSCLLTRPWWRLFSTKLTSLFSLLVIIIFSTVV